MCERTDIQTEDLRARLREQGCEGDPERGAQEHRERFAER